MSSEQQKKVDKLEQIRLLHRAVSQPDVFKFIVLRYNHFSAVNEVERDLREFAPDRSLLRLRTEREDYYSLIQKIERHTGFVLIEDFQYLASTATFFIGFNQRRDYLSKLPIQLICFLPQGSEYLRICMDNLRDWWSIRNLVLELSVEVNFNVIESIPSIDSISTLGGITEADKRKELARILARIESLEPTAENSQLLLSLYPQAHQLYIDLGEYNEALPLAHTWLKVLERSEKPEAKQTEVWMALSENHWLLGNYEKSLRLGLKVAAAIEPDVSTKALLLADAYNNIAVAYGRMGDHGKHLEYNLKALHLREKELLPDNPALAQSYNNLAETYMDLGDYIQALEYHQKALAVWEKAFSLEHSDIASSYNNLAATYFGLGDYEKALTYNQKALSIREKVLGAHHPALAESYNNLALVYNDLGHDKKAIEYMKKAVDIFEQAFPEGHPNLQLARKGLKILEAAQHNKIKESNNQSQ